MSSTDIVPFSFAGYEVRIVIIDGNPWWVARDVAETLGYSATSAMTRSLDDDERGVQILHTPSGDQSMTVISESGLYSAILRSSRAEAQAFKRWVTHEVIPEIRRTGSFGSPAQDVALPATYLEALEALVERERANVELAVENAQLTPRAIAWDAIASAEGDYSVGEAAKILARAGVTNIGPTRLFQKLANLGWTYRGPEGTWMAYADRIDRGHLAHKPQFHYHPRTKERVVDAPQLRVTLKGIELLRQHLGGGGPVLAAVTA